MFKLSLAEWKMVFGFCLLISITLLACLISIGKVHQESSYGLPEILGGLIALAGGFANWAFGESRSSSGSDSTNLAK
jgi:hypothetical protein